MSMMESNAQDWYEVVVPDPSNLSGPFVAAFLKLVARFMKIKNLVIDDLSGANVSELIENYTATIVELDIVVNLIANAVQFDWCNFLLFKCGGYIPGKDESYAEFISKTTITVRAVDDSDLYLYTRDEGLVKEIIARYKGIAVNRGTLESFVYPE